MGRKTQARKSRRLAVGCAGDDAVALPEPAASWKQLALLVCVAVACLAPFANRAFNIDEPLFLWIARQIQTHPLDPYGFRVNWYGSEQSMAEVMKNPPLASYYAAMAVRLTGWSETGLHLAFLLPALAVVAGVFFLARDLGAKPLPAGLAVLGTPGFMVSATSVMCDTMMLALWVWAVVLWRRGMEGRRHAALASAAFLMALCALTKYFGMALAPLLLAYSTLKTRRVGAWACYFFVPVAALGLYEWATRGLYGQGFVASAAGYSLRGEGLSGAKLIAQGLVGAAFTGGCLSVAYFYAPSLWTRKEWFVGAAVAGAVAIGVALAGHVTGIAVRDGRGVINWAVVCHVVVFCAGGVGVLWLALSDALARRDADSLLLCLWTLGVFVFTSYVNWTINGRVIMLMAPAVAIILVRRLEARAGAMLNAHPARALWPAVPAVALALIVARADSLLADSARTAAYAMSAKRSAASGTLWFQGHWGFQYYMESACAVALDLSKARLAPRDAIVIPMNNTNTHGIGPHVPVRRGVAGFGACRWLSTMNRTTLAGFHSSYWGPLPFVFGPTPDEAYVVLEVQ